MVYWNKCQPRLREVGLHRFPINHVNFYKIGFRISYGTTSWWEFKGPHIYMVTAFGSFVKWPLEFGGVTLS